jgi:endonuclease/exonuclease/phosphatase (EEP) superfamily protein YafD
VRLAVFTIVLAAGCVEVVDDGGPWEAASAITGELAPEIGPAPAARAAPGCTLRIATLNVHFAEDTANLAAQILASRDIASADVLMVQEIRAYPTEPGTRARRLAEALGMTWVYAPARTLDGGTHGIAIFSRDPLENAMVRRLPYIDQPLNPEQRIALAADLVIGAERFTIVDVHLDVRLGPADRVRQLHPAINEVGERLVFGGDFNTAPWSWVDNLIPLTGTEAIIGQEQAQVIDDYAAENDFAGAIPVETVTMRLPGLSMRLDDLYARGLPIVAAGVEHVEGSDHWPVWFDVDRCRHMR